MKDGNTDIFTIIRVQMTAPAEVTYHSVGLVFFINTQSFDFVSSKGYRWQQTNKQTKKIKTGSSWSQMKCQGLTPMTTKSHLPLRCKGTFRMKTRVLKILHICSDSKQHKQKKPQCKNQRSQSQFTLCLLYKTDTSTLDTVNVNTRCFVTLSKSPNWMW